VAGILLLPLPMMVPDLEIIITVTIKTDQTKVWVVAQMVPLPHFPRQEGREVEGGEGGVPREVMVTITVTIET